MPESQLRSTLGVLRGLTGEAFLYATQQAAAPNSVPLLPPPGVSAPAQAPGVLLLVLALLLWGRCAHWRCACLVAALLNSPLTHPPLLCPAAPSLPL